MMTSRRTSYTSGASMMTSDVANGSEVNARLEAAMPVSSSSSRVAATTVRSPSSIRPPGSDHCPLLGAVPRRTSTKRCARGQRQTTATAAIGACMPAGGVGLVLGLGENY